MVGISIQEVFRVCLVSIFSDAGSKQAAATKIQILIASLILHILVVTNKVASLRRGENMIRFWYLIRVEVKLLSLKNWNKNAH
jgi:hypothetical protein